MLNVLKTDILYLHLLVISFIRPHELKTLGLAIEGSDNVFGGSIVPTRTLIII
jgi:hypothetical protein